MSKSIATTEEEVISKIYFIRGKKVMLDRDLAEMYGVETRVLNQAVTRNEKRFPSDFMFQLNEHELESWKSQNVISNKEIMGLRKPPNVFTEQGVAMLSSVLNSEIAIEVNIQITRISTRISEVLSTHKELEHIEKNMFKQDSKMNKQEKESQLIFSALKQLLDSLQAPVKPMINMIDVSGKVDFQTQFDKRFGTIDQQRQACARACKAMLTDKGYKVTGGEGRKDILEWDKNKKLKKSATYNEGVELLNKMLEAGKPVIVGVNRMNIPVGNANKATSHFVLVVARNEDGGYRFYDPGTSYKEKGTSPNNILYFNSDGVLGGTSEYNKNTSPPYKVTEARPTN